MKNKLFILLILILVGASSCQKFLEEDARSSQTIDNFFKTEADAEASINSVYQFLYSAYDVSGYDDMENAMLEMITGQWNNVSQWPETGYYYTLTNSSASPYTLRYWTSCYKGIESANMAIERIPNITFNNEADKNNLLGEAHFLRAYYYYVLVNIFGDVPLKLTQTNNPLVDGMIGKSAVAEIYDETIIPDLVFAASNLKRTTPAGSGRANIGAAKSLLAKVYLSTAGHPMNRQSDFSLASDLASQVINSQDFSLFQSDGSLTWFDKLNNHEFDNMGENIWGVNFGYPDRPNSFVFYFLPKEVTFNTGGVPLNGFGGFYPAEDFLDSFAPEDLRGRHNQGFFYNEFTVNSVTYSFPWAIYKFFDKGVIENPTGSSGKDFPVLRYADVLLTYAEAQNESEGSPNALAYKCVNDIRERAGLAPISGLGNEQFREEVWKQRYWELCAENKYYFDIIRTQKVYNSKTGTFVPLVGFTLPSGATVKDGYLPYPIPMKEVQINPLLD